MSAREAMIGKSPADNERVGALGRPSALLSDPWVVPRALDSAHRSLSRFRACQRPEL